MFVRRLRVRIDDWIVGWDRLVVQRPGTRVNQLGTAWRIRIDLKVSNQSYRAAWRRAWRLPRGRDMTIGRSDRVLIGNVLAVFLNANITWIRNILGQLRVVIDQLYLSQLLSQR